MSDLYTSLSERFSESAERVLNQGGSALTYIPQAEVVNRLNRVFGVQNWSMQVMNAYRDQADPDWVVAHVRLTATVSEIDKRDDLLHTYTVVRDGVGGQKVKRTKNGDVVDLGDEFKGAVSDALKKAATLFGVGLYLARDEDALIEENAPQPHPRWEDFMSAVSKLDDLAKKKLKDAWTKRTDKKMTATTVNDEDMDFLYEQVVAASFDAAST